MRRAGYESNQRLPCHSVFGESSFANLGFVPPRNDPDAAERFASRPSLEGSR